MIVTRLRSSKVTRNSRKKSSRPRTPTLMFPNWAASSIFRPAMIAFRGSLHSWWRPFPLPVLTA